MEATTHDPKAPGLPERFGPQIDEVMERVSTLNTKAVKFIREHPGTCLLGALAVGFVVGKLASRR